MRGSWFQRHLVHDSYSRAKTWGEQLAIDKGKPLNAEYEQWTIDLTEQGGSVSVSGTKSTNGIDRVSKRATITSSKA